MTTKKQSSKKKLNKITTKTKSKKLTKININKKAKTTKKKIIIKHKQNKKTPIKTSIKIKKPPVNNPAIKKEVKNNNAINNAINKETSIKYTKKSNSKRKSIWIWRIISFSVFCLIIFFTIQLTHNKTNLLNNFLFPKNTKKELVKQQKTKKDTSPMQLTNQKFYFANKTNTLKEINKIKENKKIEQQPINTIPQPKKEITPPVEPVEIKVIILNGSGIKGQARKMEQILTNKNIKTIKTGNADRFNYQNTIIKYPVTKLDEVLAIKDFFDKNEYPYSLKESFDVNQITIILGKDYK